MLYIYSHKYKGPQIPIMHHSLHVFAKIQCNCHEHLYCLITVICVSGQSTKACELFLKNRAAAVQTAIRQLRIEGATLLYIHKLCNIFFTSLLETAKEFQMDFAGNTGCYSAFVVWSRSAMRMFVDAFSKQVVKMSDDKTLSNRYVPYD